MWNQKFFVEPVVFLETMRPTDMVSEMMQNNIRNVDIHSLSMLLLLLINIFIPTQKLSFYARNISIHI